MKLQKTKFSKLQCAQNNNIGQTLKQDKAYTLQHSYSKAQVKLEPKL